MYLSWRRFTKINCNTFLLSRMMLYPSKFRNSLFRHSVDTLCVGCCKTRMPAFFFVFSPALRGDNHKSYHCSTGWRSAKRTYFFAGEGRETPSVLRECNCPIWLIFISRLRACSLLLRTLFNFVVITLLCMQFKWQLVMRFNTSRLLLEHWY